MGNVTYGFHCSCALLISIIITGLLIGCRQFNDTNRALLELLQHFHILQN